MLSSVVDMVIAPVEYTYGATIHGEAQSEWVLEIGTGPPELASVEATIDRVTPQYSGSLAEAVGALS